MLQIKWGKGAGFGLHQVLDQFGAMLGPLIIAIILFFKNDYRVGFIFLSIPALLTLLMIFLTRRVYPHPEKLEIIPLELNPSKIPHIFWIYLIGSGLIAAGYADFPLIAFHFQKTSILSSNWIPIFYTIAMASSAISALVSGWLYGGGSPKDNWFPSLKKELEKVGLTVIGEEFPDNDLARANFWLPFLINELKADEKTLLIGHSSGAIAAMRLAEKQRIWGSVLVGAYYTDLGMEKEKQSAYFDMPWDFKAIQNNQSWIALFSAQNDPWIPIEEPRHLHLQLNCEYHEYKTGGHFGGDYNKTEFPELSQAVIQKFIHNNHKS